MASIIISTTIPQELHEKAKRANLKWSHALRFGIIKLLKIEEGDDLAETNTDINEFGISFGVGLPVGKELSTFNLGFEIGKRGTIDSGLVKENYFNFFNISLKIKNNSTFYA